MGGGGVDVSFKGRGTPAVVEWGSGVVSGGVRRGGCGGRRSGVAEVGLDGLMDEEDGMDKRRRWLWLWLWVWWYGC